MKSHSGVHMNTTQAAKREMYTISLLLYNFFLIKKSSKILSLRENVFFGFLCGKRKEEGEREGGYQKISGKKLNKETA